MKLTIGRFNFNCAWQLIMVYALMLTLLLNLGFWQLRRSEEKRLFLMQQQTQSHSSFELTADFTDNPEKVRYQQVVGRGRYDTAHQILIDNQIFQGKAGYFVLTPFILSGSNKAVLVNRGWVAANPERTILPELSMKQNSVTIKGRLNYFPDVGMRLKGADSPSAGWPTVVQLLNPQILAQKLTYPIFPFQIELEASQPDGYTRQWLETKIMPPEQHIGYAIQWFALALTLSGLFFWYSINRIND